VPDVQAIKQRFRADTQGDCKILDCIEVGISPAFLDLDQAIDAHLSCPGQSRPCHILAEPKLADSGSELDSKTGIDSLGITGLIGHAAILTFRELFVL
jgi:hypothetical protein